MKYQYSSDMEAPRRDAKDLNLATKCILLAKTEKTPELEIKLQREFASASLSQGSSLISTVEPLYQYSYTGLARDGLVTI
jgi:hypothetical protein